MNKSTIIWILVVALFVLHQDLWFWEDSSLVFKFLPIGLAYHIGYSVAAAIVWAMALKWAWPTHIEEWADEFESPISDKRGGV